MNVLQIPKHLSLFVQNTPIGPKIPIILRASKMIQFKIPNMTAKPSRSVFNTYQCN